MNNSDQYSIERLNEDIQNLKELRNSAEKRFHEVQNWKNMPNDFKNEMEQKWFFVLKQYDDMIACDFAMKEKLVKQN